MNYYGGTKMWEFESNKLCKSCKYGMQINRAVHYACDYMAFVGKRRDCKPTIKQCEKYKKLTGKREKSKPIVL